MVTGMAKPKVKVPGWIEKAQAKSKSRSGTTWTEEDYKKKGYGTIKLRLREAVLEKLDRAAALNGGSRQLVVEALIDKFHLAEIDEITDAYMSVLSTKIFSPRPLVALPINSPERARRIEAGEKLPTYSK